MVDDQDRAVIRSFLLGAVSARPPVLPLHDGTTWILTGTLMAGVMPIAEFKGEDLYGMPVTGPPQRAVMNAVAHELGVTIPAIGPAASRHVKLCGPLTIALYRAQHSKEQTE